MSISPFNAHPVSPETEKRRARLVLAIAIIGIAATLLAYAASPGVRHAVHSVKGAVSHALDHDTNEGKKQAAPAGAATTSTPATTNGATVTTTGSPATQKSP
jgi:type II secretory pathway pseudopilin PulG